MLTLIDFLDASAFERFTLDAIYPLIDLDAPRLGYDLRTSTHDLVALDVVSGGKEVEIINRLRPLFFGSSWKVLDLLVEYGLSRPPSVRSDWTISDKSKDAARALLPPLSTDRPVWDRVSALYTSMVEPRHCLVHRRVVVSPDGAMTKLADRNGRALPDVSAAEQVEFSRVAQRCSLVIQSSVLAKRDRQDLVYSLDQLSSHHGFPAIGGGQRARLPEVIRINAVLKASSWRVDVAGAVEAAKRVFPGRTGFDLEIHFPGSGNLPLVGRLEDAPAANDVPIDPRYPPDWIDI